MYTNGESARRSLVWGRPRRLLGAARMSSTALPSAPIDFTLFAPSAPAVVEDAPSAIDSVASEAAAGTCCTLFAPSAPAVVEERPVPRSTPLPRRRLLPRHGGEPPHEGFVSRGSASGGAAACRRQSRGGVLATGSRGSRQRKCAPSRVRIAACRLPARTMPRRAASSPPTAASASPVVGVRQRQLVRASRRTRRARRAARAREQLPQLARA